MRLLTSLLLLAPLAQAAASAWGFDGASVSVAGRKSNVNVDKQVCVLPYFETLDPG
jgi:hypothetical protein